MEKAILLKEYDPKIIEYPLLLTAKVFVFRTNVKNSSFQINRVRLLNMKKGPVLICNVYIHISNVNIINYQQEFENPDVSLVFLTIRYLSSEFVEWLKFNIANEVIQISDNELHFLRY